jgi:hypothetical protein
MAVLFDKKQLKKNFWKNLWSATKITVSAFLYLVARIALSLRKKIKV